VERIGHYKIVSELGRGGMGVVLKAHEQSLNRFVAIKVLGEHLEDDAEYVERFVREAQSAAALSHPNIVQIYAISEDDGHHYFAMEYVQGTSIQRMIQTKGKMPPADAARLILQAAAGLQAAHAQDVVHRDIKPANLMVTERGLVKIADFGLALMGGATSRLTATGMLMGTPGYLSPEQCLDQSPDQRTDIYSLGVTLFEMVTGTMPFRADSPLALLRLIIEVEPPDIRDLNPEVDDELRAIIARMLAKDPEDRYPNCTEVIADIQGWLEARGESMHSVAGAVATGTAAGMMSPPPAPVTEEQINSEATVVLESGSTKPASAATPPPAPPPPEVAPVAAAPEPPTAIPATQPQPAPTRSRTGLIVAAIAVIALGAVGAAAFLTIKSGVLDGIFNRGDATVAELAGQGEAATTVPEEASDPTESDQPGDGTASLDTGESGDPAALDPPVVSGTSSSATVGKEPIAAAHQTQGSPKAANIHRELDEAAQGSAATSPPPRIVAPPPTATVVLAVGERLLAVEAEEYVKARLQKAGIEVLEITAIPGLEGFVNTESRPSPEQVRDALRPYARYLVPLRVEYLGDRAISYMGQRDTVFQARVNMGLVDLRSGRPMGKPAVIKLEYTQLNADEVVGRDLRKATTGIVQKLPRE
jgi:eukaryotic-like serine/threonine-protein kinase